MNHVRNELNKCPIKGDAICQHLATPYKLYLNEMVQANRVLFVIKLILLLNRDQLFLKNCFKNIRMAC